MANSKNTAAEDTFFQAVRNGDVANVRSLVAASPELLQAHDCHGFGGTPLNLVVFKKDREMIDALLDLGADPNDLSDWWPGPWNAAQCALYCGHDELAEDLVSRGAKVGIHEAAGLSRTTELKTLLDSSPESVHQRGGDGCTPLHFAGSPEVVDLLVQHGADLDARDVDHYSTPAQYLAKQRPEVARHLFQLGATPDIFSAVLADDKELVQKLIQSDSAVLEMRINQQTFPPGPEHDVHNILTFVVGENATALHAAATGAQLEMIDLLVKLGMNVDEPGGYDDSAALHMAAWNDSLGVTKHLVAAGADINIRSGKIHNNSPAGWAIVAGSADVFCFLMDSGAEQLDHFEADAQAAVQGKFRQYKAVDQENYDRILARLSA